jgi:hypothetical protein
MSQHDNPLVAPEITDEITDEEIDAMWQTIDRQVQAAIDSNKDTNPRVYHMALSLQEDMAEMRRNYNECECECESL